MFDKGVSLISLLIGIGAVFMSSKLPKPIFAGQMSSGVFPTGIGYLIIMVSILLFIETARKKPRVFSPIERSLYWAVLLITLYVIVMKPLGFIVASFLFIFIMGLMLGARKYITLGLNALLFPVVIYALFSVLGILLPQGILPI